nr:laccase-2 [Arenicola marina]
MGLLTVTLTLTAVFGAAVTSSAELQPSCNPEEPVCSLVFDVTRRMTMMYRESDERGENPVLIDPLRGNVTIRYPNAPPYGPCQEGPLNDTEFAKVLTVDGSYRQVLTVNGRYPGPPVVVYEGQEMLIRVVNSLANEAFTLHMHGLEQRGTPWMDGAGGVSQCAIQPGEAFTYRFRAHPVGTHWYHPHQGLQRSEGAFGAFIVLPRQRGGVIGADAGSGAPLGSAPHPLDIAMDAAAVPGRPAVGAEHACPTCREPDRFDGEFIMVIQDWYQQNSDEIFYQWINNLAFFGGGYGDRAACYHASANVDGFKNSYISASAILINGKGRKYDYNSTTPLNPFIPLEEFQVTRGGRFKFRIIQASLSKTLRVSIDQHVINVIATDGADVTSQAVDDLIISPGERFDIWIDAADPSRSGNYWIRVESTELMGGEYSNERIVPRHAEAILRYAGATREEPVTPRKTCTQHNPCTVLNCPYRFYPSSFHTRCLPITTLTPRHHGKLLTGRDGRNFKEHMLHFRYALSENYALISTINGNRYQPSSAPAQTYPTGEFIHQPCPDVACQQDTCSCTNVLDIDLGDVIQLVFLVYAKPGLPVQATHPVHMHGHHFQVVKIGWPSYNETTGEFLEQNPDLKCEGCCCNTVTWANPSWNGGNMPGVDDGFRPVTKDTVQVPVGGYVVVRFRADNPGYWFMHCHMEFHNAQGMALTIREGSDRQMAPLPKGFKRCGDFTLPPSGEQRVYSHVGSDGGKQSATLTFGVLAGAVVLVLVAAGLLVWRRRTNTGYHYTPIKGSDQ